MSQNIFNLGDPTHAEMILERCEAVQPEPKRVRRPNSLHVGCHGAGCKRRPPIGRIDGAAKLLVVLSCLLLVVLSCLLLGPISSALSAELPQYEGRQSRNIDGWLVIISEDLLKKDKVATEKALELLSVQLKEIDRVVPKAAVAELRKAPLWFSPEYPNAPPRAEYHPGADWLRKNKRDPVMEKGVEFTNVGMFERETKRMPNFALHELAHAYHDRYLQDGFGNAEIKAAYEKAKAEGIYERVEQRFGDGRSAQVRAYAMTTPQEYFAECTEAFFSTNDFFPFQREELARHDPRVFKLLAKLWGVTTDSP